MGPEIQRALFLSAVFAVLQYTLAAVVAQTVPDAGAAEAPAGIEERSATVRMVLEESGQSGFPLSALGDLGAVQAGSKVRIRIEVVNPFETDVPFTDVALSCACTELTFPDRVFRAGSVTAGELVYRAPLFARRGELAFSLSVLDKSRRGNPAVAMLRLRGTLAGVIDAGNSQVSFEVRKGHEEFEIPVSFTAPVQADELAVELSPELRDIVATIGSEAPGKASIRLTVARAVVPDAGLAGEVRLVHGPSGRSTIVLVNVFPRLPIRISPSTLWFEELRDRPGVFCATGILVVRGENDGASPDQPDEADEKSGQGQMAGPALEVQVSADLEGRSVEVTQGHMAAGIFRLRFEVVKKEGHSPEDDRSQPLRCRVLCDDGEYVLSIPVQFLR